VAPLWRGLLAARAIWISGLCWAVMFTAFMIALTLTSVANVLVTMAVGPLLTALFARIFLHHHLSARTWTAIIAAAVGIGWMFGEEAGRGISLAGSLVALAVPIAASVNWTLLQRLAANARASGIEAQDMLPAILLGALLSAAVTLPLAGRCSTTHDWPAGCSAWCNWPSPLLVVRLTRVLPAPEIALLALLEVIFGIALAWLGAGEVPATSTLAGGVLVLAALALNRPD
jgi:drug/metabolite transporter (DMT)-like permease